MKLKVVTVDLGVPPRMKRWGLRLGIPLAVVLGGGTVAYAAGLVTWATGQTLTAADLNNNFGYLQGEIATLQQTVATPPSSISAGLTLYNVTGGVVSSPCTGGPIVTCTCPAGSYVVSGGADCGLNSGTFLRESRPLSTNSWRATCSSGTADTMGYTYTLVCSKVGP
jgi:hypothetical protein